MLAGDHHKFIKMIFSFVILSNLLTKQREMNETKHEREREKEIKYEDKISLKILYIIQLGRYDWSGVVGGSIYHVLATHSSPGVGYFKHTRSEG